MSAIIRWNPLRELAAVQSAMDRAFEENWRNLRSVYENTAVDARPLALDVHEDDASYTVTSALPGVKPEDIHVRLHDDVLTIEGEVKSEKTEEENGRVLLQERRYGKFSRSIRLPQPVNNENIEANYADGVLTLTLPKTAEAQPRLIPVRSGKQS